MSTSPSHPAYYTSRRQLWTTLPNNGDNLCCRWFRRMGFGNNMTTLFSVWYSLIALGTVVFLTSNAISRYQEFKAQAYNPRFGGQWNEITPLHLQLAALIFSLSCFPVLMYAILSKTGHSANDYISLGLDIPHLQRNLLACPSNQQTWKTLNNSHIETQPLNGDTLQRTRNGSRTPEIDANLNQLLVKRRGEDWLMDARDWIRPFSTVIFVLMTYACLFPVCVMEAEQLRNEVMDPRYVYQSNLDSVFGRYATPAGHRTPSQSGGKPEKPNLIHTADSASLIVMGYSDDQPLPPQTYAVTPSSVSLEYTAFTIALAFLTVQYAAPFFFTSRSFSLVFTFYTALSGFFLAVDVATMAVVYKIATVGHRQPGGWRQTDTVTLVLDKHISPLSCLFISAACVPIVLSNLAAIYSYGYEQFGRALVNYAQLLISGDLLPCSKSLRRNEGSVISKDSCNGMNAGNDPGTVSTDERAYGGMCATGLPVTIAVTTKYWHRTSSTRMPGREQTPTPGQHYLSNASEISMTLKRNRPPGNGNYDLNGSVHTLSGGKDVGKPKVDRKWRHFRQLSVASVTFFAFLITRICLAGPLIRCYWKTGLQLALIDIVFSVLYMVTWLLIWFGLGVKSAWRFRLLHSAILNWSLSHRVTGIGSELTSPRIPSDNAQTLQQQQQHHLRNIPQLAYAGGYWPYITYPQWVSTDQPSMAEGLPPVGAGDPSRISTPMVNGNLAGIQEGVNSTHDSLYGCFPEDVAGGQEHQQNSSPANNYQIHGIGLRVGPPTVSDDSELPATVEDNAGIATANYFCPIPGTAGKTQLNSNHYIEQQQQQQFSASNLPFIGSVSNQPYESSSQDTSPIEPPGSHVMNKSARQKGSKVSATLSLLQQRQYTGANGGEPTYATLANLPGGNHIRPPSTNSFDADNRLAQSSTAPFHQSVTAKRNNSRVTFRDPNRNTRATTEVVTGSSDSGVYTNGNSSNQNSNGFFDQQPSRPGRLKPENLALFTRSQGQTSPINGRMTPNTSNSQKYYYNLKQTMNGSCLDENDLPTEMVTDFTGTHRVTSENGLYTSQKMETTLSESNDHLCSQV